MANKKISALTALGGTPAVGDILPITDVSDTTGSPQGTTKRVTVANLVAAAPQGDLVATNNLSDLANAVTARANLGLGTAATSASTDFSSAFFSTVSETTTSRTLSDSDNGKVIVCTNASTITVTIPSTLTAGFNCKLVQGGAGIVGAVAGAGTTLSLIGGKAYTSGQYQVVDVINYASNAYVLDSNSLQTDPAAWSGNGHSLSFDGVDDHCTFTGTTFSDGARTFSMWFKFSALTNATFGLIGGTAHYIGMNPSTKLIIWWDGSTSRYKTYTGTVDTSTWLHLLAVDNNSGASGNCVFYVNGVDIGVPAPSSNISAPSGFTVKYIGRKANDYFPGIIDEVAIWDSDQSSNKDTIYSGGTPDDLTTLNPLHWWRMGDSESGAGSTITDQGSNGTLTLTKQGATASTDTP